jgi:ferredoxin-thioredoxin reductase catalytic subunit
LPAYEDCLERARALAEERGLVLNSDWERVRKVIGLMTENKSIHGYYYCPCKKQNDPPIHGTDPLCPCPELDEELEADGRCFCKLFFAKDAEDAPREESTDGSACCCSKTRDPNKAEQPGER